MYVTINPLGYSRTQNCILHVLSMVKFYKFKKNKKRICYVSGILYELKESFHLNGKILRYVTFANLITGPII